MGKFPVEEYKKTGFDFGGYLEPEVTSDSEYPDYLQQEAKDTINKLLSLENGHTVSIGFMTDLHYAVNFKIQHQIRLRRLLNTYKDISENAKCSFLAIGGDVATNGSKQYVSECMTSLRNEFKAKGIKFFPVTGNHDTNDIWDNVCVYERPAINHLLPKERYSLFFDHIENEGAVIGSRDRLYYYVDNQKVKLRYIFLNCCDVPFEFKENGALKYAAQDDYFYSKEQLDWLTNEALSFSEDGWTVVIIQHVPIMIDFVRNENLNRVFVLHEILKARKDNAKCHYENNDKELLTEVFADLSQYKKCYIAGMFFGHIHKDRMYLKDGIHYTSTANSVMYKSDKTIERNDGDKTELLMDIITVDTKNRTVNLTRVGSGEDRSYNY